MGFPACSHSKLRNEPVSPPGLMAWLAAEPFRVCFFSGAVWSIIGVSLWPLFYAGHLAYYPGLVHSRIMIEAFGGAFVLGFMGTAGPRMAGAPRLTPPELVALFGLHVANGVLHLQMKMQEAGLCFIALLALLLAGMVYRILRYGKSVPPQMMLALLGLLCGIGGASLLLMPSVHATPAVYRLAEILHNQGLLLLPVMGIGAFLFPRLLGGGFGESATEGQRRVKLLRAIVAGILVIGSFFVESAGWIAPAYLLRSATVVGYLLVEINWSQSPGRSSRGSLTKGLYWALGTGFVGLVAAAFVNQHIVAVGHLLYIGGFGMLILVVASRVLFGHSGELDRYSRPSWTARWLIALALIAATTRASAEFWPAITISHYIYAAWTWGLCVFIWMVWHFRRFLKCPAAS